MPSTFPRSERSRRSQVSANNSTYHRDFEDGPRSNLDNVRYTECVNYLQDVCVTLLHLQIIDPPMLYIYTHTHTHTHHTVMCISIKF
jgi:hypothetical protein